MEHSDWVFPAPQTLELTENVSQKVRSVELHASLKEGGLVLAGQRAATMSQNWQNPSE